MSKPLLIIVCITAFVSAAPVQAQQTKVVSIDALVKNVITSNPERRFYMDQIRFAGAERDASDRPQDPEVTVDVGQRRTADTITGVPLGSGAEYGFAILQPIDFAGRPALRRAIAEHQIALARLGLAQFDATLSSRARSLAYALIAANQKAAAARDVAGRMRALALIMSKREAAGPAPMLDASILEAGAITAERNATLADTEMKTIVYELNQLRGARPDLPIRVAQPDFSLPALSSADHMAQDVDANNFELQALRAQSQQQGLRVDLAEKSRLPTVAVGPYYDHSKSDIRETNLGVRLTTTLPLWNSQAAGVAQEQGRQAQADASLLAAKRRILRQVYDQAASYETKRKALANWPASAPDKFAQAATAADDNFRQGAIPVATYVEMQRQYLDALSAMLDTKREALEASLQLRVLNGGRSFGGAAQ
jgi:outer membrane protein, heavy metal efflux system